MGFLVLWLGIEGLLDLAVQSPLPSTWDEVLDWTEDASERSVTMTSSADMSWEHGVVRIVPLVSSATIRNELALLPFMSYLERSSFYTQSVRRRFL